MHFFCKGLNCRKILHWMRTKALIPLSQWCILHIPPYFRKIYKFPPFSKKFINSLPLFLQKFINLPLYFRKIYKFPLFSFNLHFFVCLICGSFFFFDHDAHLLDAPGSTLSTDRHIYLGKTPSNSTLVIRGTWLPYGLNARLMTWRLRVRSSWVLPWNGYCVRPLLGPSSTIMQCHQLIEVLN